MATIIGTIVKLSPLVNIETKKGGTITKRSLLLDCTRYNSATGERSPYDCYIPLDFFGDKTEDVAPYAVGDVLEVGYVINSRPFERKDGQTDYALSLRPLSLTKKGHKAVTDDPHQVHQPAANPQATPAVAAPRQDDDELPF